MRRLEIGSGSVFKETGKYVESIKSASLSKRADWTKTQVKYGDLKPI
jgi:hypothetical protein